MYSTSKKLNTHIIAQNLQMSEMSTLPKEFEAVSGTYVKADDHLLNDLFGPFAKNFL